MRRRTTTLADRSSSVIHHALRWFTGASFPSQGGLLSPSYLDAGTSNLLELTTLAVDKRSQRLPDTAKIGSRNRRTAHARLRCGQFCCNSLHPFHRMKGLPIEHQRRLLRLLAWNWHHWCFTGASLELAGREDECATISQQHSHTFVCPISRHTIRLTSFWIILRAVVRLHRNEVTFAEFEP